MCIRDRYIISKSTSKLYFLKQFGTITFTPLHYTTVIWHILEYASPLWHPTLSPMQSGWKLSSGEHSISQLLSFYLWLEFQLSKPDVFISVFSEKFVNPITVYIIFSHPIVTQPWHHVFTSLLYILDLTSILNDIVQQFPMDYKIFSNRSFNVCVNVLDYILQCVFDFVCFILSNCNM